MALLQRCWYLSQVDTNSFFPNSINSIKITLSFFHFHWWSFHEAEMFCPNIYDYVITPLVFPLLLKLKFSVRTSLSTSSVRSKFSLLLHLEVFPDSLDLEKLLELSADMLFFSCRFIFYSLFRFFFLWIWFWWFFFLPMTLSINTYNTLTQKSILQICFHHKQK